MLGLIAQQHATVLGTVKDLESSGWVRIVVPEVGGSLGMGTALEWKLRNTDTYRFMWAMMLRCPIRRICVFLCFIISPLGQKTQDK